MRASTWAPFCLMSSEPPTRCRSTSHPDKAFTGAADYLSAMVSAGVELSCRTGQAPQALLRRPRSSFPGNHLAAPGLRQCSARTASRRRGLPLRPAATAAAVTLTAPAPEEPPSASNGASPLPVPSQADAQPKAPEPALFSDAWKEAQRKDMRQVGAPPAGVTHAHVLPPPSPTQPALHPCDSSPATPPHHPFPAAGVRL